MRRGGGRAERGARSRLRESVSLEQALVVERHVAEWFRAGAIAPGVGIHEHRGRGYGAALLAHTCQEAVRRGASRMALLATSDGQRVYERCRFLEVARFGYWYRSFRSPS